MPIPKYPGTSEPTGPCANASHEPGGGHHSTDEDAAPAVATIALRDHRPECGRSSSAAEKQPKNNAFGTPSPAAIGSARIAGR
jgi:hypothetical protein